MSKRILFAAAIACLGASAVQAACPSKSTSAVRMNDVVTLELAGSKPGAMGTRQALEAAGYSILRKGTVIFDRGANTRMFCDGTNWISFEPMNSSTDPDPSPMRCAGGSQLAWGYYNGGCKASAPSGSKADGTVISVTDPTDGGVDCGYRAYGSAKFICRDGTWTWDKSQPSSCYAQTNCK